MTNLLVNVLSPVIGRKNYATSAIVNFNGYKYFVGLCLIISLGQANDGAYFMSGNQLIPIHETQISIAKEILKIQRVDRDHVDIDVYYEFFNPDQEKNITVGFEALSPSGDVDANPIEGMHPYMSNFSVNMNDQALEFKVAYVKDQLYAQTNKIDTLDKDDLNKYIYDSYTEFNYVYYFDAPFKKGKNIIKHRYRFNLSGSVVYRYDLDYILTAATRWGNQQIDDFTLHIDMGEFEDFFIPTSFFKNKDDWEINGLGTAIDTSVNIYDEKISSTAATRFSIRKGTITFRRLNFKPQKELFILSPIYYPSEEFEPPAVDNAIFVYKQLDSSLERKLLHNLPFAQKGYIFKNKNIQSYFENNVKWYEPNPSYVPTVTELTPEEQNWVKKFKE